jgi:menaquinone-dependent protoporphyrinogen IX oxidase
MNNIKTGQRGLIVYESKYGAAQQYAEWVGAALSLPITMPGKLSPAQLQELDYVVIGTPVYNGLFRIKNWLKQQVNVLNGKKLFFFIVNASAPAEQAKRDQFVLNSIPPELRQNASFYFLPGRLIHNKLNFFDGLMLSIAARLMKDPEKRKAIQADINGVKKENIIPLFTAVKAFSETVKVPPSAVVAAPIEMNTLGV